MTLDDRLAELDFSGIAVITGPAPVERCVGLADRAAGLPVTPATRFGLASLTKMFTAVTTVAVLPDPHTPVARLLPADRRPATLRPDVTVHHLLSHTSGIADYAEEQGPDAVDYATLWTYRPCYRMERPADFLPLFADRPPYTPRGPFRYSNAGYVLLALVIEELTGLPYPAAVAEHVFGPAGMTASGFFRLDDPPPDVAVGYLPSGRTNVYSLPAIGGGDGGAYSTAGDLDRFLRAYPALADPAVMLAPYATVAPGVHMGYGAYLYGDGRFGHGGGDPGFEVLVQRLPRQDACVIALCNMEGRAVAIRDALVATVLGND